MSKFLAPIHTLLFNKILVLESIEKKILENSDEQLITRHDELKNEFGDFIPDEPLETLIDQNNIHGWLQQRITVAESRQAAFVKDMIETPEKLEVVANAYFKTGREVAKNFPIAVSPADALNALNNVLLEGMPCDRVNAILEFDADSIKWKTTNCVHKNNWENNGTPVVHYYRFREAFTKGFLETLNQNYVYNYSNVDEQLHEIKVK